MLSARLTNVVILSPNPTEVASFYTRLFGFSNIYEDATSTFLRTGGSNLVFVLSDERSKAVCLDLTVPDLEEAARILTENGVEFSNSQNDLLVLQDPDENLIEIVRG